MKTRNTSFANRIKLLLIREAVFANNGNKSAAARKLGINRPSMMRLLHNDNEALKARFEGDHRCED